MNKKPIDVERDKIIERVQVILKQYYPPEPKGSNTEPLHQQLIQAMLEVKEEASQQAVAQARLDALEEAAKLVCYGCETGRPIEEDGGKILHKWGNGTFEDYTFCDARDIRLELAQTRARGAGNND